jgi:RNA polymerase sigma-70 factor (ECF subfamily)
MLPPISKPLDVPLFTRAADESEVCAASTELLRLLYRQVRTLAGPRPDLDDLVQAAAERALKALPTFERRSAFSTWTYGIAYRTVLDHDRWLSRFRRRFSFAEDADGLDVASASDVEHDAMLAVRARRLHVALETLPPAKRAVIVLHDLEGLALKEVAAVVSANERTVRSRLIDARKKLASILTNDPAFDSEGTP